MIGGESEASSLTKTAEVVAARNEANGSWRSGPGPSPPSHRAKRPPTPTRGGSGDSPRRTPPATQYERRIPFPSGVAGALIGAGGETARSLTALSRGNVNIDTNRRVVTVSADSQRSLDATVARVERIIADHAGNNGGAPISIVGAAAGSAVQSDEVSVEIKVPRGMAGAVIGVGGETVRQLKAMPDIRLVNVINDDSMVRIVGRTQEAVAAVERRIEEIFEKAAATKRARPPTPNAVTDSGSGFGSNDNVTRNVPLPDGVAYAVIGKGGEVVKMLNRMPGIKRVQVSPEDGHVKVIGRSSQQVAACEAKIEEIIKTAVAHLQRKKGFVPGFSVSILNGADDSSIVQLQTLEIEEDEGVTTAMHLIDKVVPGPSDTPGSEVPSVTHLGAADDAAALARLNLLTTYRQVLVPSASLSRAAFVKILAARLAASDFSATSTNSDGVVEYRSWRLALVLGKTYISSLPAGCSGDVSVADLSKKIAKVRFQFSHDGLGETAFDILRTWLSANGWTRIAQWAANDVALVDSNGEEFPAIMWTSSQEADAAMERISMSKNYFEVLGLDPNDTTITDASVRGSFNVASLFTNPAKYRGTAAANALVREAYDALRTESLRSAYRASMTTLRHETSSDTENGQLSSFASGGRREGFVTLLSAGTDPGYRIRFNSSPSKRVPLDEPTVALLESAWKNGAGDFSKPVDFTSEKWTVGPTRRKETEAFSNGDHTVQFVRHRSVERDGYMHPDVLEVKVASFAASAMLKIPHADGVTAEAVAGEVWDLMEVAKSLLVPLVEGGVAM